jgi:multiple sugar transport system ATP-binding protein
VATVALENVSKVFSNGVVAVDSISLDVADGEVVALLGPAGCGKSTVLRIVAGLEDPTSGSVRLDGRVVNDLPPRERNVAMVLQTFGLYPHMSVKDNIGFPPRSAGVQGSARHQRIEEIAAALSLTDDLVHRPGQLSGVQVPRAALGRALVRRPSVALLDEPLSNLDSTVRARLRAEIAAMVRELGVSTIHATNDQAEALTVADRVAVLHRGVLHGVGSPADVYRQPATIYVAALVGSPRMNLLEASVYVHLDRYIALHLGQQALYLPWHDVRSREVARFHGERIVVGVRAEAIVPASPEASGDVLHATVRYLEHRGHESLVFLDIGAYAVALDNLTRTEPVRVKASGPRISKIAALFRRGPRVRRTALTEGPEDSDGFAVGSALGSTAALAQRATATTSVLEPVGRPRSVPAEVAVRLPARPELRPGDEMNVIVRVDELHFFDGHGRRIGTART